LNGKWETHGIGVGRQKQSIADVATLSEGSSLAIRFLGVSSKSPQCIGLGAGEADDEYQIQQLADRTVSLIGPGRRPKKRNTFAEEFGVELQLIARPGNWSLQPRSGVHGSPENHNVKVPSPRREARAVFQLRTTTNQGQDDDTICVSPEE
jgi:hypothetical protein